MSRTMGVPLPHQSHLRLCAPISAPAVAAGRADVGDSAVVAEDLGDMQGAASGAGETVRMAYRDERGAVVAAAGRHRALLPYGRHHPTGRPILPRRAGGYSGRGRPPSVRPRACYT